MTENEKKMTAVVKPEDIESLIELFEASDWDEMYLEIEGLELFLSSDPKARISAQPQHPTATHASASAHAHATTPQGMGHLAPPPTPAKEVSSAPEGCIAVKKLFTSVRAGTAGVIREICIDDAEMVEYGQTLFYIEPA